MPGCPSAVVAPGERQASTAEGADTEIKSPTLQEEPSCLKPDPSPGGRLPRATGARATSLRLGLALLVIATAQLMVVLDATIVNVALPHIQRARLSDIGPLGK